MNIDNRFEIFCRMIEELDRSVYLIDEYDKLLHDYNGEVMFQAESQMIKMIGDFPGITASQISKKILSKRRGSDRQGMNLTAENITCLLQKQAKGYTINIVILSRNATTGHLKCSAM